MLREGGTSNDCLHSETKSAVAQNKDIQSGIIVDGTNFSLNGTDLSYRFHVHSNGDLLNDHFGGPIHGKLPDDPLPIVNGWSGMPDRLRREFPDHGRGDFRNPAIRICHANTHAILDLKYRSHEVMEGKLPIHGLPATFGTEEDVSTLVVHLFDDHSHIAVDMSYSVFPEYNAIVRSVSVTNNGDETVTIEELASFSVDLPYDDFEMISLRGDWARETHRQRQRIDYGIQGFKSSTGFSSHFHNPFFALVAPSSTESQGEAWGFSLVYSGSFAAKVERGSQGLTRAMMGLNPDQFSWVLRPGETLNSPECVSVYSSEGLGGMSRSLHGLYRNHLMKSKFASNTRPVLLNSWEALYFDVDQAKIYQMALESAALDVKLFVMDDGWFGDKYPRVSDTSGLGDWVPNPRRFPDGLTTLVNDVTSLKPTNSSANLRFGLWIEPEMVNPKSSLYERHPDWVLSAAEYPSTEQRNQLILNLGRADVQEHIINSISEILLSADITYVKWDHNRCINESPSPRSHHAYMLGIYRVFEVLTSRFPDILWEGCAAGGGRCDPGILQYFPQVWTSDNTDALDRIYVQFGSSIAYPACAMSGHISAVPNHQTGRTIPLTFRAHVAMMCGSFGLELNPAELLPHEKSSLPELIHLAEKLNPIVVTGNSWRLRLPEESNWPAMLYVSQDETQAVLFYFQIRSNINHAFPRVKLQGLDNHSNYLVDGEGPISGFTLMNLGLQYSFESDYGSKVIFLEKETKHGH